MSRSVAPLAAAGVALALLPGAALAHDGLHGPLWAAWSWEPTIVGSLGLLAGSYALGWARLRRRAGRGLGRLRQQAHCFVGGLVALVAALLSPLEVLAHATFAAHMIQHLLLILVAAPLLVLARPLPALLWALHGWGGATALARGIVHVLAGIARSPWFAATAWVLHTAALWAWHAPPLYDAAVAHRAVHAAEHAAFLGTALLFWWALLAPAGAGRLDAGAGVLYVFTMGVQGSVLAALLTFAPAPWYVSHGRSLEDQQFAGLLMWIPSGVVYALAGLWLLARWLREAERRAERREGAI